MTERLTEQQHHEKAVKLFEEADLAIRDGNLDQARRLNIEAGKVSEVLFH